MTTWKVQIDWDNDGFTAADDITSYVMDADWTIGLADEEEMVAGEYRLNMTVDNTDKRFSPESGSISFAPKRRMRVQSISSLGTITHWYGYFETIAPEPAVNRGARARITGTGIKSYLERRKADIELLENVTADTVIGTILQRAREFPAATELGLRLNHSTLGTVGVSLLDETSAQNLQSGATTFPFVGDDWDEDTTAYQAIADLVRGERGRLFLDRGGTLNFWNRRHLQSLHNVQGTISNHSGLDYIYGDIINDVTVVAYPRTISAGSNELLWRLEEEFELRPGQDRTVRARYAEADSDLEISGRNFQPLTVTRDNNNTYIEQSVEYEARSAKIHFNNVSNGTITVSDIQVRGQKITKQQKQEFQAIDEDTIGLYGRRSKVIDFPLLIDPFVAESLANFEAKRRAEPIGQARSVSIRERADNSLQTERLDFAIGSVIAVQDTQLAHDADYVIIGERHSLTNALTIHDVTFDLAPLANQQTMLVGITGRNLVGTHVVGY